MLNPYESEPLSAYISRRITQCAVENEATAARVRDASAAFLAVLRSAQMHRDVQPVDGWEIADMIDYVQDWNAACNVAGTYQRTISVMNDDAMGDA